MSLAELLKAIMDAAKELLESEGCSLLLADQKTGDLIFDVVIGDKGDIIRGERVPKGKGIAGIVASSMEPIIVDDPHHDDRWYHAIDRKYQFNTKNLLCVPMQVMGDFVGVLEVVNTVGRDRYDVHDLEKAEYIANQAAIAINNRRLYDELTNRIEELTALYEVAQSISLAGPDDDVIDNICKSLAKSMKVGRVSIIFFDENEGRLTIESAFGLPESIVKSCDIDINSSIAGHVFRSGDPMMVSDINREIPSDMVVPGRNYKTDSFISVPIQYKNKTIGVLSCADKNNGKYFDSFDLRIVTMICSQVSQIYTNLVNQKITENQRILSRDIDIAAEIQKKILRGIPASFNNHMLAAFTRPARSVGGDFYDFSKLNDNKYSILVADISGKGIPAALFMGSALNVVRAERRIDSSPAGLLKNANRYIFQDSEYGMFVTLFYAVIDSHNNLITYASAGHNDQMLVRSRTREVIMLNADGKALGLSDDENFEERVILYEPGDFLILFTDGVTECFGGDLMDLEHGERMLAEIALRFIDYDPDKLIDYLKEHFKTVTRDTDFVDDITVLAIKF
ncbi:MAG TPA: SpoIIE family protein phosphatase [Spirochaetota bacterium]|nr:SpoIIE family protein phosphatase [Spirochaetota bacterium]HPL17109.1 SpoIIE family protein phosphatase [Spirochaetota bacterium]HQF10345.1 SpoIIE family protein phosphatase [Spirochaetota bacterium]HQH99190.1 SpoIIE family protein phosphatase [Spirochaetota bacterium]HQJ72797.1 SpoIIE family protein phosphatase [Spirochaetota bacterium]